jgi:methylmalonyl-CoA decarboxylase
VWSAGYDISELDEVTKDALGTNEGIRALVRGIEEFPAPVIAMIDSGVYGAAVELALVCDLIVATPEVTFTITPARLGLMLNVSGVIALLDRLPPAIVKEMAFAAQPLTAEWAERWGVVNRVVPKDQIEGETEALARRMADFAPLSLAAMKEEMRLLQERSALSPRTVERMQALRRQVFGSEDYREGLSAFKERRIPAFRRR